MAADGKPLVVLGTSGSTDYLRDVAPDQYRPTRQDRRYWVVSVPHSERASNDGLDCDGLHDQNAPIQYLCSRCFPALPQGDLADFPYHASDEACRDDGPDME